MKMKINRRSFFGFIPAALAGVAFGAAAAKPAWGEGIPAILKAFSAADEARRGFFKGRTLTPAERKEFLAMMERWRSEDWPTLELVKHPSGAYTMNIPPAHAEILVSRKFHINEICRFMGVHPRYL